MTTETKATHTPGPWHVIKREVQERPLRISAPNFMVKPDMGPAFAFLPEGRADIQEANARLIAAAPDLLAACEAADSAMKAWSQRDIPGWNKYWPADLNHAWKMARAAIAKAKGGTP